MGSFTWNIEESRRVALIYSGFSSHQTCEFLHSQVHKQLKQNGSWFPNTNISMYPLHDKHCQTCILGHYHLIFSNRICLYQFENGRIDQQPRSKPHKGWPPPMTHSCTRCRFQHLFGACWNASPPWALITVRSEWLNHTESSPRNIKHTRTNPSIVQYLFILGYFGRNIHFFGSETDCIPDSKSPCKWFRLKQRKQKHSFF